MDQAKPEDEDVAKQYIPSLWSHRLNKFDPESLVKNFFCVLAENSAIAKQSVPCELDISYGTSNAQKIDIFGAKVLPDDAPIFVFVHGGYWVAGRREDSSHFVKPFYDAGVICITLGYDLVSKTVTIPDIVNEIVEGITFILKYASARKSGGVYICGHSAGGHLIMMALSSGNFSEDINLLKGLIPFSGIFDLNPLVNHPVGQDARITKEIADAESPITVVDKLANNLNSTTRVLVSVAQHDSPAFRRQSQRYEERLRSIGIKSEYMIFKDEDHFSGIEKLKDSDYALTKIIIKMIRGN